MRNYARQSVYLFCSKCTKYQTGDQQDGLAFEIFKFKILTLKIFLTLPVSKTC
jgi:hypothetical protein